MAITGMDAIVGDYDGIDALGQGIYSSAPAFEQVAIRESLSRKENVLISRISSFDLDLAELGISPDEVGTLPAEDLLMLKVARRALLDAGFSCENDLSCEIGVIVIAGPDKLMIGEPVAGSNQGNTLPFWISNLWDFTGPTLAISNDRSPLTQALHSAAGILAAHEADAVLIGAIDLLHDIPGRTPMQIQPSPEASIESLLFPQGEGAAAVVVRRIPDAQAGHEKIYGIIERLPTGEQDGDSAAVSDPIGSVECACQNAFTLNEIPSSEVGYLEAVPWSEIKDNSVGLSGLAKMYPKSDAGLTCAFGSLQALVGDTRRLSGLAGLIKAAWCLYHRVLPSFSPWQASETPSILEGSAFYIPSGSKSWFVGAGQRRVADLHDQSPDGAGVHILITENGLHAVPENQFLTHQAFRLLPLTASSPLGILSQLATLKTMLSEGGDYRTLSIQAIREYLAHPEAYYALSLVGGNQDELVKEIEYAQNGIQTAVDKHADWQTPLGSYFTADPLGYSGGVSFVYPGAFNSFIGLGKDLFHLFPKVYTLFSDQTRDIGQVLQELTLYPRSLSALSSQEIEAYEARLNQDAIAMLTSGTSVAVLFTLILREYFGIHPRSAFGYSLGETSMFFATQVWKDADPGSSQLNSSSLFRSQLTGPKNAVRSFWGMPPAQEEAVDDNLWQNFLLMTAPEKVIAELASEQRVYLTHINTPRQVVIGGDPQGCRNVIQRLHCSSLRAPFDHVLHCEPMASGYDELVKLHTFPINHNPDIALYSAAGYKPVELDSQKIAHSIARTLCSPLDFPRLVNQVYADGARIFIELGAGSNSSKWIGEILKGRPHAAMSINRKGADDYPSMIRLLAKLISHRVPMDLSSLIPVNGSRESIPSLVRTITLSDYRGF
ncbi:MAG: PfaB family protein [Chloroflexi bacterium]|nr:PfaB family protein [Chloroflexota bacterium]